MHKPRNKHVYGKRSRPLAHSAALVSSIFASGSSSPASLKSAGEKEEIAPYVSTNKQEAATRRCGDDAQSDEEEEEDLDVSTLERAMRAFDLGSRGRRGVLKERSANGTCGRRERLGAAREGNENSEKSQTVPIKAAASQPPPSSRTLRKKPLTKGRRIANSPSAEASNTNNDEALKIHIQPLLRLSSDPSTRHAGLPTPFADWTASLTPFFHITKIAEASYGEVYRLSLRKPHPDFDASDESVLKLIALKSSDVALSNTTSDGSSGNAQEDQMSAVPAVASEVALLRRMTRTPGFANYREVRVLRGRPGGAFLDAWAAFDREARELGKEGSLFPNPAMKGAYGEGQLWAVVEMQDAGTDLEKVLERWRTGRDTGKKGGRVRGRKTVKKLEEEAGLSIWACWDVFWGVALALGKGEEEAKFEHRDLHLGNICVRLPQTCRSHDENDDSIQLTVGDVSCTLGFTGLETTIIDYTLSRAELGRSTTSDDSKEHNAIDSDIADSEIEQSILDAKESDREDCSCPVAFLDLEKEDGLFEGDADVDYQYEIYRLMRASVFSDAASTPTATTGVSQGPKRVSTNTSSSRGKQSAQALEPISTSTTTATPNWRDYHPRTNLVWLHFVLDRLLSHLGLPSASLDSDNGRSRSKTKDRKRKPAGGKARSKDPSSAWLGDLPLGSLAADVDRCAAAARAREIAEAMLVIRDLLLPASVAGCSLLGNAGELVGFAVGEGWLGEEDVLWYGRD